LGQVSAVANATPQNPPDLNEVLSQAEGALETSNMESAMQLYTYAASVLRNKLSALSTDMTTSSEEKEGTILMLSKVLGKMAEAKVSLGDPEGGQRDFLEATKLLSGDGPSASDSDSVSAIARAQWREARAGLSLYLGQLSTSKDALGAFGRAIDDLKECVALLDASIKNGSSEMGLQNSLVVTRHQLCGAYCSVAELYLTDLCFEENAENDCESALQAALQLDESTSPPDAVQAMANLRLSQNRVDEAVGLIIESYNRVKVGCEALSDLVGVGSGQDPSTDKQNENVAKELMGDTLEATNKLPGFEFRCQMAKLLLECATVLEETAKDDAKKMQQIMYCVEAAIQVLGSLLAENDEVIEIWYLLGCSFSSLTPKNIDASQYYFETAIDMLEKVRKGMKEDMGCMTMNNQVDEETKASLADVEEKIKEVRDRLSGSNGDGGSAMEED